MCRKNAEHSDYHITLAEKKNNSGRLYVFNLLPLLSPPPSYPPPILMQTSHANDQANPAHQYIAGDHLLPLAAHMMQCQALSESHILLEPKNAQPARTSTLSCSPAGPGSEER